MFSSRAFVTSRQYPFGMSISLSCCCGTTHRILQLHELVLTFKRSSPLSKAVIDRSIILSCEFCPRSASIEAVIEAPHFVSSAFFLLPVKGCMKNSEQIGKLLGTNQ